jgi:hypothetical protein
MWDRFGLNSGLISHITARNTIFKINLKGLVVIIERRGVNGPPRKPGESNDL